MNVIKRDGKEVLFDGNKIYNAILKANKKVIKDQISRGIVNEEIRSITDKIINKFKKYDHAITVEEIQDTVEHELINLGNYYIAKEYITYRYKRNLARKANTIDDKVFSIVDLVNEDIKQENSNKNPTIVSTQRDYVAGEVSKDLTDRVLLPDDVVEADRLGLIHFHDKDYFLQKEHNCDLVNIEDMLQNGTVISGTMIEKPHSFSTACTVTTQIIAQVSSNQFGGQSVSLAHLAPFVDISRKKIRKEVEKEITLCANKFDFVDKNKIDEIIDSITEERVKEEIKNGVQTIQYQVVTLMTTNG